MSEYLLYYKRPDPTTWVYLSSFLTIGLYFVFHRFWSIRNLDIVLLILLAPGLLMVHEGRRRYVDEMADRQFAARQTEAQSAPRYIVPGPLRGHSIQPASGDPSATAPKSPAGAQPEHSVEWLPQETSFVDPAGLLVMALKPAAIQSAQLRDGNGEGGPTSAAPGGISNPPPVDAIPADPLAADPEALDERLESTSVDPSQSESEEELSAKALQRRGFIFLFAIEMLILVRLLTDPTMVRRPLLDPNLTVGGLYFISISLFIFMMVNVATSTARMEVLQGPGLGPGYALMHKLPMISTRPVSQSVGGEEPATPDELEWSKSSGWWVPTAKILAILAHLAIIVGLVLIGNRHFGNLRAGVGCALLYLMLPYTAQMTGRVDHALPAALLLWAVLCYRRPLVAGVFLGLAAGLVYYPLFLLPLWCSFYWQRGVRRFGIGVLVTLVILGALLSFGGTDTLVDHLRRMFGLFAPTKEPRGIWSVGWDPRWRLPVIVAFGILCSLFAIWPSPKNLGSLIGCSAAVMVAVQFWHGYGGGLYIAWFLPLLLLTIFRPNLQDRIAVKVVRRRSSDTKRRPKSAGSVQAV